jgi:hypothetical protein
MSDAVPEAMQVVLNRYLDIQQEERRLQEEKDGLQKQLAAFMDAGGLAQWYPEVGGLRLSVRYRNSVRIDYDEEVLRNRLGDRYGMLLRPDIKKIRRNLDAIEPSLSDVLDLVGSPVPEKVKEAIEAGRVRKEEFAGAFKREEVVSIAVSRRSEPDRVAEGGLEPYGTETGEA